MNNIDDDQNYERRDRNVNRASAVTIYIVPILLCLFLFAVIESLIN